MGLQFTVTEEEPDLTVPEDTIIVARLAEIKPRLMEWTDKTTQEKKSKQRVEFWWQVISPERYNTRRLKGECDAKIDKGGQFHSWAEAILDRQIPIGMGIDTDDLVGLNAEITVRHRKSKDGTKTFEEVDVVMPASAASVAMDKPPF
jgi:hypothetical protein